MPDKIRCSWCLKDQLYMDYHDNEWGVPVHNDRQLFELLILEGAQAGLSWHTVLKKRENYRQAFDNFDPKKIVNYDEDKIQSLLLNPGIIRNQLKIRSVVTNAKAFLKIQETFDSFDYYIWQYTNHEPIINYPETLKDVPATSPISDAMSKDLLQRGFKFVGSTICYAFMQATGMVNDHFTTCWKKTG